MRQRRSVPEYSNGMHNGNALKINMHTCGTHVPEKIIKISFESKNCFKCTHKYAYNIRVIQCTFGIWYILHVPGSMLNN